MSDEVDLLVRGTLVRVTTGALEYGAVAIDDGEIVALEERPATRVLEATHVTPGLIDAHTHIESSMVPVGHYGATAVPHDVTSVVHDPHEVANVLGPDGVRAFVAADDTPLKHRTTVPSSVPASDLQDAGGAVDADAVADLLSMDRTVALGEVMDTDAILDGNEETFAKIAAARDRGLPVDGHVPGVTGSDLWELARYVDTDHESVALEEARAKADAGLHVFLLDEVDECR
jgi:adenine deaminase